MPNPLFGPEVRLMLDENNVAGMKEFCESLHPATVAETLTGDFSVEETWRCLSTTSIRHQAAIFEYFPIDTQVRLVEGGGREQMAHLIEKMSHDDRVDLLRRLMPRVAESLLRLVDEADRKDIAMLVAQQENTAGALMTTDYAWLPPQLTATEALDRLRLQAPESETIYYIYILDEHRHLLGVLSLRDLILAQRQARIRDIMEETLLSVKATDDREQVAKEMARYDLIAIPVVDADNRMVGIVTHDDVMDVVVKEATEDVYRLGGVGAIEESYLEANFFTIWRKRAMWLACLFLAELFTFTAMASFEDSISQLVVLSLFVPLCLSTGGNSGSQAATLITRAMALGQVTLGRWWTVLRHELIMGVVLGLTLGLIGFWRGWLTPEDTRRNPKTLDNDVEITLPAGTELKNLGKHGYLVPAGAVQRAEHPLTEEVRIELPHRKEPKKIQDEPPVYRFPAESVIRTEAVSRWRLGMVIALAVAIICLWGTLIGSMLPLVFKRLGFDPGYASSPFVATFVDVTGIVIYFTIASIYLL
jgi:magnesium transporter